VCTDFRYQVFPEMVKIHIAEPYGPLAVRLAQSYIDRSYEDEKGISSRPSTRLGDLDDIPRELLEESYRYALRMVFEKAVNTLRENGVLLSDGTGSLRTICLYQPHRCKKDIMFTNMVFSLALGHANDLEYLWTSDSDTWVYPDTLCQTIGCMSTDPLIGGSCSALSIHNGSDSLIAQLGAAAYVRISVSIVPHILRYGAVGTLSYVSKAHGPYLFSPLLWKHILILLDSGQN